MPDIDFTQHEGEEISYSIDTTEWGGSPTSPSAKAFVNSGEVTDCVFPTNSPSISGDDINLSPLKNISSGCCYRIQVKFTIGGNIYIKQFYVMCN